MSTDAAPEKAATVLELLKQTADNQTDIDDQSLLGLAIAEAEKEKERTKQRAIDLDVARDEARESATVKWGPDGQWTIEDLAGLNRLARMYAHCNLLPDHYYAFYRNKDGTPSKNRNYDKPNVPAVARACARALAWGVSIDFALDHSYVFEGCRKVGLEAVLVHTILAKSGILIGAVEYITTGDRDDTRDTPTKGEMLSCTAVFTIKGPDGTPQEIRSTCDMRTVRRFDWKSKIWNSNPEMMLEKRTLSWGVMKGCPWILAGCVSIEDGQELEREAKQDRRRLQPDGNAAEGTDPLADLAAQKAAEKTDPHAPPTAAERATQKTDDPPPTGTGDDETTETTEQQGDAIPESDAVVADFWAEIERRASDHDALLELHKVLKQHKEVTASKPDLMKAVNAALIKAKDRLPRAVGPQRSAADDPAAGEGHEGRKAI